MVDYYEDPYSPGLYRYETNRYPYVEVQHHGELFHAQAKGWKGGKVMITRIKNQLGWVDNGEKITLWVPAVACTRIRRDHSTWVTTEDDHYWHQREDAKISYRVDPWTADLPEQELYEGERKPPQLPAKLGRSIAIVRLLSLR